eukprot:6192561-Pleurochrysis_carterae.AAC.4
MHEYDATHLGGTTGIPGGAPRVDCSLINYCTCRSHPVQYRLSLMIGIHTRMLWLRATVNSPM